MQKFIIEKTDFEDVVVIVPRIFKDSRGYFCETYNADNLQALMKKWYKITSQSQQKMS